MCPPCTVPPIVNVLHSCGTFSQVSWFYSLEAELGLEPESVWPQAPGLWGGGAGVKDWMSSLLWGCESLAKV